MWWWVYVSLIEHLKVELIYFQGLQIRLVSWKVLPVTELNTVPAPRDDSAGCFWLNVVIMSFKM